MPKIPYKIIFLISILSTVSSLKAQNMNLGFEVGAGQSKTDLYMEIGELLNYQNEDKIRLQINSIIEYSPQSAFFSVYSGIGYNQKGYEFSDFHYLSIPFVIRLNFGKTFKFYIGGGVYGSILLKFKDKVVSENSKSYNHFDYGNILNAGLIFKVKDDIEIFIDYKNYIGRAIIYYYAGDYENRNYSHYLNLGVSFAINKPFIKTCT